MTAQPQAPPRATLADLMRVDGKAELIGGEVVTAMPSGDLPTTAAFRIARRLSLDGYWSDVGTPERYAQVEHDAAAGLVDLASRKSLCAT